MPATRNPNHTRCIEALRLLEIGEKHRLKPGAGAHLQAIRQ